MTVKKVYGMNTRSVGRPQPKFKTPFKTGFAPGEPERFDLERKAAEKMKIALANVSKLAPTKAQAVKVEVKKSGHVAFDLSAYHTSISGSVLIDLSSTDQRNHQIVNIYGTFPKLDGTPVPNWLD